jgi:hypothetical protein
MTGALPSRCVFVSIDVTGIGGCAPGALAPPRRGGPTDEGRVGGRGRSDGERPGRGARWLRCRGDGVEPNRHQGLPAASGRRHRRRGRGRLGRPRPAPADVSGPRPRHRSPPARDLLRVAVAIEVDEITRLATTIDTWQEEVLAFFDTRASNAPTSPPLSGARVWVSSTSLTRPREPVDDALSGAVADVAQAGQAGARHQRQRAHGYRAADAAAEHVEIAPHGSEAASVRRPERRLAPPRRPEPSKANPAPPSGRVAPWRATAVRGETAPAGRCRPMSTDTIGPRGPDRSSTTCRSREPAGQRPIVVANSR